MADQEPTPHDLICNLQSSLQEIVGNMQVVAALASEIRENMEMMQRKNMENLRSIQTLQTDTGDEVKSLNERLEDFEKKLEEDPRYNLANARLYRAPSLFQTESGTANHSPSMKRENDAGPSEPQVELFIPVQTQSALDTESPEAASAIRQTSSPLSPEALKKFLDKVKGKSHPYLIAQRYTRNIHGLYCQLRDVQCRLEEIPPSPATDKRLLLRLPKLMTNLNRDMQNSARMPQKILIPYSPPTDEKERGLSSVSSSTPSPGKRSAEATPTDTPAKVAAWPIVDL